MTNWDAQRTSLAERFAAGHKLACGKLVALTDLKALLEAVLRPGDRVCLEGDNQKQADLLAGALAAVDVGKVHDLHMVQSGVVLPEHLDVFETGVAKRLDYSYSGPQSSGSWSSASTQLPAFRWSDPALISRCSASRNTRCNPG